MELSQFLSVWLQTQKQIFSDGWEAPQSVPALYSARLKFLQSTCLCARLCCPELKIMIASKHALLVCPETYSDGWRAGKISLGNKLQAHFDCPGKCFGERSEHQLIWWQNTCTGQLRKSLTTTYVRSGPFLSCCLLFCRHHVSNYHQRNSVTSKLFSPFYQLKRDRQSRSHLCTPMGSVTMLIYWLHKK